MDLRLMRPRKLNVAAGAGVRAVFTCGCRRRVQRAGDRSLGGAGAGRQRRAAGGGASARRPPVRLGAAFARSSPEPVVRRTGVSPRAPGGGGEPRAARPRADAAAGRSRSAPHPPRAPAAGRRRARSLACRDLDEKAPPPAHPAPRLRPVFLWARQRDGTVQEVRCEDYDPRNRIRIARTPTGWRVIPRTEIFDSILVTSAPAHDSPELTVPQERRRRRRPGRPRRRRTTVTAPSPNWGAPDLESHIPSHTIAVTRIPASPAPVPSPPEPTPLDNLLAVAELEFNQQRGEEALDLELQTGAAQYPFLPEAEEVAHDVMSFELGEPKPPDEMFFEQRKTQAPERAAEEDAFHNDMGVHKDLFETISEAHYLPELGGPHDEALLESLVEKGCEDNQILGQTLDKLANLVHGSGDYAEEEDDMLLSGAPVADIIDRLEQSLESPSRSSMTAAQGLLHLHHIGDQQQAIEQTYMTGEVFAPADATNECTLDTLSAASQMQDANEVNHLEYDQNATKRLQSDVDNTNLMYTEQVPDIPTSLEDQTLQSLPDQSEVTLPSELPSQTNDDPKENVTDSITLKLENDDACDEANFSIKEEDSSIDFMLDSSKDLDDTTNTVELVATDLSVKNNKNTKSNRVVASVAETTNSMEDNLSEKSDDIPKDLSVQRRLPTPHASPRRIDIPRAPSRESDAMQSPQPSGIPAVPSSPEIFTMPQSKSKQSLFLETLLSSPSPKMYTSEVTITKQQCEPLNLGKHRKSASPTITSCSDEIRKLNKEFGEPQEKKGRRESTEDSVKIHKIFNKCERDEQITDIQTKLVKKTERDEKLPVKYIEKMSKLSPMEQLQSLRSNSTFNIPDPMLVPKNKLNTILAAPGIEIPSMLMNYPELRLPEAFSYPHVLQDPDILVISLAQLEGIILNDSKQPESPIKEPKPPTPKNTPSTTNSENALVIAHPDQINSTQPKPIPSMDALAGDIDAATSAAINQMLWIPYLSQLEAMAACSQNMDFIKALNSAGYNGPTYPELAQVFSHNSRFVGPGGFPVPPIDYDNRMQFLMWQEAMNQANQQAQAQRQIQAKPSEPPAKEMPSKSSDVQNPYVHSTKSHQNKLHSNMSSRTSPMGNYTASQRAAMQHNSFLQNMYPGMNPNIRPNMPLPGLQIPYFNANMMGSQRSPRSGQQKSPTSPYYPNNNYLQSMKHSEAQSHQRSSSTGPQESPRPRISVKSLQNLLEPSAAVSASSSTRRGPNPAAAALGRRREEPEVGSTTPLGEPPTHMPPHPHDPASFHLWHPLFGNQKTYSPWSWTSLTATGD